MPLKGINWFRFKEHLRKCIGYYIVTIIVMVVLTSLVYTSTRPQIPAECEVLVYLVDSYTDPEPLAEMADAMLLHGQENDETLQSVRFESILYNDPETDYTSAYLLMARMSLGDGDVYMASETALPALTASDVCLPLDEYLENGWLAGYDLETLSYTDEDGNTYIAAIKIDPLTYFVEQSAFNNVGGYLIIAANGGNIESTMDTIEMMVGYAAERSGQTPIQQNEPAEETDGTETDEQIA